MEIVMEDGGPGKSTHVLVETVKTVATDGGCQSASPYEKHDHLQFLWCSGFIAAFTLGVYRFEMHMGPCGRETWEYTGCYNRNEGEELAV